MARTLEELEADFEALYLQIGDVSSGDVVAASGDAARAVRVSTEASKRVERADATLARLRASRFRR